MNNENVDDQNTVHKNKNRILKDDLRATKLPCIHGDKSKQPCERRPTVLWLVVERENRKKAKRKEKDLISDHNKEQSVSINKEESKSSKKIDIYSLGLTFLSLGHMK